MKTIPNWKGEAIEVASSRGGTLAVVNPFDNLVKTGVSPWPPPEIVQKLYESRQFRAFDGPDHEAVKRFLGYYSDLQSLHSEDAITWSVFGTLAYTDKNAKRAFTNSLLKLLNIPVTATNVVNIWLWRRIPHPDNLVPGGPEIDFGIQTEQAVILGEAKWRSGEGQRQGKAGDKSQFILRREFFEKYGKVIFGAISHYIVLVLSLREGILEGQETDLGHATLYVQNVTWESVCRLDAHPLSSEIKDYLVWKKIHSKPPSSDGWPRPSDDFMESREQPTQQTRDIDLDG